MISCEDITFYGNQTNLMHETIEIFLWLLEIWFTCYDEYSSRMNYQIKKNDIIQSKNF